MTGKELLNILQSRSEEDLKKEIYFNHYPYFFKKEYKVNHIAFPTEEYDSGGNIILFDYMQK